MGLAFLLYFVSCFGFRRSYWSGVCKTCPASVHKHGYGCESNAFKLCEYNRERKCGPRAGCEGNCCREEEDLCGFVTGSFDVEIQIAITNPPHPELLDCSFICAEKNYEGMKYDISIGKCYCVSGIGTLDSSKDWVNSCEFTHVPAYLTHERKKCSDDNGQVLSERLCRYHIEKNADKFGVFKDVVNLSSRPSGCFVEGKKRYWNEHTVGEFGQDDINLICRGAEPLLVSGANTKGKCPGGQQLTEFECQYQVVGFGTWAWTIDSTDHTCGCLQRGNLRHFNTNEGACDITSSSEQMICKKVDPQELCSYIVKQVEATDEGSDVPEQVDYLGQIITVDWNIVKWDPKLEAQCINTTAQHAIAGPTKCSNQDNCGVEYTETKSHTNSWTSSNGGTIAGSESMGFEAGIPEIAKISTNVQAGLSYTYTLDKSGSTTIESSSTQKLGCSNYEGLIVNCFIFAIETTFNTTATASPQFDIVEYGNIETSRIDCFKSYSISTEIDWEAMTGNGYDAMEMPVCTDTPNACENANEPNCISDEYIHKNCPASCAVYGQGPAACPSDADCGFTPVIAGECPSPGNLEKPYTDCMTVFNGPPILCQATIEFPDGAGPEDWNIRNCPDNHGNYYNIFYYACERAQRAKEKYYESHPKENPALKNQEVEKVLDVVDEEVIELKMLNRRLQRVNKVLRAALEDFSN